MKTKLASLLMMSFFALPLFAQAEEASGLKLALSGRPLLTAFFWGVIFVLFMALYVAVRAYYSNKSSN